MGGAMLDGFLRSDSFCPSDISISNPHTDRLAPYAEQGVQVSADNRQAAAGATLCSSWLSRGSWRALSRR